MSLPAGVVYDTDQQRDIGMTPFLLFQCHRDDYYNMSQDSVKHIQEETILSHLYFSPQNVNTIQKMLRYWVFKETHGEYWICKQEEKDLQIVMRSIFLQHARHNVFVDKEDKDYHEKLKQQLRQQIKELNLLTVDELTPNVISEIKQYYGYLERAFEPRQIMDLPECVSKKGTKSIPSVTKVFGDRNN